MKKNYLKTALLSAVMIVMTAGTAAAQTLAFPGAEGFGRFTTGGRGGTVYHVKNLTDDGKSGSFRYACEKSGARTIVFDVSGTIHLTKELKIKGDVTIAGQTAPGDGICVADYPVTIVGNNAIVRYMRFRLGNKYVAYHEGDGFGSMDVNNIIIDHCSVSWSIDECLSVYGGQNLTVQWCMATQSLNDAGHSKGKHGYGGNWGGSGATYHHNLLAHHNSRTPRLGPRKTTQLDERLDMRNNVIYNWGNSEGCYGGEAMNVNIINNYYKPGPASPTNYKGKRIAKIGVRTTEYVTKYTDFAPTEHVWGTFFIAGNVNSKYSDVAVDNWANGVYNQNSNSSDNDNLWEGAKAGLKLDDPIGFYGVTTHSAEVAYERVLDYAGASLHRDSYDALMVSETRNGTAAYGTKGIIDTQDDNKPADADESWSAWPTLNSTAKPTDSDNDGMPDTWEDAHGLNKSNAADGKELTAEGYTNLEVYMNSLVADITAAQNAGALNSATITDAGYAAFSSADELDFTGTGIQAYIVDGKASGKVSLSPVSHVPAGTGLVLRGAAGSYPLPVASTTATDDVSGNGMVAVTTDGTPVSSSCYVLARRKADSQTGFVKAGSELTLDAGKAYLDLSLVTGGISAGRLTLPYDETTGINMVQDSRLKVQGSECFDLQGRRVSQPKKGVYVNNGKLIIVR